MQASVTLNARSPAAAAVRYLLRIGDTCLIHAQRLAEWTGHAPVLEEDIALTNMALDLVGQARGVYTLAGQHDGQGLDEDHLAFLRDERDYLNPTLVELPNNGRGPGRPGDFALTVLRNLMVSSWLLALWQRLQASSDTELAGIAAKAVKEARYHQTHAADWTIRLGDGTADSHQRCQMALALLWPYTAELFDDDATDAAAVASGLGPAPSSLQADWQAQIASVLAEATLTRPADTSFRSTGRHGVHSEHMGFLLAEMQHLQRAYPGGVW
jgi:ring-1,2-phenylacetyl-CoA epoxidase subunit PaaC